MVVHPILASNTASNATRKYLKSVKNTETSYCLSAVVAVQYSGEFPTNSDIYSLARCRTYIAVVKRHKLQTVVEPYQKYPKGIRKADHRWLLVFRVMVTNKDFTAFDAS